MTPATKEPPAPAGGFLCSFLAFCPWWLWRIRFSVGFGLRPVLPTAARGAFPFLASYASGASRCNGSAVVSSPGAAAPFLARTIRAQETTPIAVVRFAPAFFQYPCRGCAPPRLLEVQPLPMPEPVSGHGKARHGGGPKNQNRKSGS